MGEHERFIGHASQRGNRGAPPAPAELDADDSWFAGAASHTLPPDRSAATADQAIGAAALSLDAQSVRRVLRQRHRPPGIGRPARELRGKARRRGVRLAGLGALLVVLVVALAVIAVPPRTHTANSKPQPPRPPHATRLAAMPAGRVVPTGNATGLLLSPNTASAARVAARPVAHTAAHHRAPRHATRRRAPIVAAALRIARVPAAARPPIRPAAPRLRAPARAPVYHAQSSPMDQSYGPGDLPPASSAQ